VFRPLAHRFLRQVQSDVFTLLGLNHHPAESLARKACDLSGSGTSSAGSEPSSPREDEHELCASPEPQQQQQQRFSIPIFIPASQLRPQVDCAPQQNTFRVVLPSPEQRFAQPQLPSMALLQPHPSPLQQHQFHDALALRSSYGVSIATANTAPLYDDFDYPQFDEAEAFEAESTFPSCSPLLAMKRDRYEMESELDSEMPPSKLHKAFHYF